jgi:tetratricopeptide (TPR) repeat protein
LENAQKLEPNFPETLLALGYYQFWVLPGPAMARGDYKAAKRTFGRVGKMLPNSSEVPNALALIARREGHWDESIAYFEQALALDPRNVEILSNAASTYDWHRQYPVALKLWDRVLDLRPNDPDIMATKAAVYQTEGNLQEAARYLPDINCQTSPSNAFDTKIDQLRLERNYDEAIRFLQARLAQFHYASQEDKARHQVGLAFIQRLAGDTTGAKVTAEEARNTFDRLYRDEPDNFFGPARLSNAYALMGEKDLALKLAERAVMMSRGKTAVRGPAMEENLALLETMFGENSRAISTLTQLLQTPYLSLFYPSNVTPALLRLDPLWDPLRGDPAFQKLCEEKQP